MRRINFLALLFLFLLFSLVLVVRATNEENKVSPDVLNKLESQEKVNVIVSLNSENEGGIISGIKSMLIEGDIEKIEKKEDTVKFSSGGFAAEITKKELDSLIDEKKVNYIEPVMEFKILLQNSTKIMNATRTWNLQVNSTNLTGINQAVCIIDTGIDYDHPDLIGRNLTNCNLDCIDNEVAGCFENCSITDLNGHGTHVAGIVAASGGIFGMAPGVNFIGLKVFPGSEKTGATTTGIKNAIDWCVSNSAAYNISVITMSLGTDTLYNSYCDSASTSLNTSINNAFNKNISVTVATGNDGSLTNISLPACMPKAIPVSSVDKSDSISSFSDRNSLVKLLATGGGSSGNGACSAGSTDENRICSTYYNGAYISMSGTSMATPHVAGAIAMVNEFLRLSGQTKTPKEIEAILNNTGKRIGDASTGLNFSRINVYDAIISLDNPAPDVTLVSPSNNQINISRNQTFSCNATDLSLKNVSFYLWNSSISIVNTSSASISGASYSYSVNVSNLSFGSYKWNCLFYDEKGNSNFSSSNFTLTIGSLLTSLISPQNNNYTNLNYTEFSCHAETEPEFSLKNITFYLWNSTELVYNETKNISGISNTTNFNHTFVSESNYLWTCLSYNNNSNSSLADNFSITYDITKPNVSLVEPFPGDETSSSTSKIFYYNASDNFNISRCDLIVNNVIVAGNSSGILSTNNITYTLTPGTYSWKINCTDMAGNQENSGSRSIVITAPAVQISSSGGGGGGGAVIQTYTLTKEQASSGYTKEIAKNEKIVFTIFDEKAEQHELTLDYVGSNFANITLRSAPIKIVLGIGQSIKLNLTSSQYYDLYIKLEGITNNKAKLTIQTIHEILSAETPASGKKETGGEAVSEAPSPNVDYGSLKKMWRAYAGLYIALILGIVIAGYLILKSFKKSIKLKIEIKFNKEKWKRN